MFVDEILEILASGQSEAVKKPLIVTLFDAVAITKVSVDASDMYAAVISAEITHNGTPVEGVGLCAKDMEGWEFKPGRSSIYGIASVKVIKKGPAPVDTFFILTSFWKNEALVALGIDVPKIYVTIA